MFLGMPRGKLRARETTQIAGKRLLKSQTKAPVKKVTRTILTSSCGTSKILRNNSHLLTSSRLAAKNARNENSPPCDSRCTEWNEERIEKECKTQSLQTPQRALQDERTLVKEVHKSRLLQQLVLDEGNREKQGVTHQDSFYIVDSDDSSNVMV